MSSSPSFPPKSFLRRYKSISLWVAAGVRVTGDFVGRRGAFRATARTVATSDIVCVCGCVVMQRRGSSGRGDRAESLSKKREIGREFSRHSSSPHVLTVASRHFGCDMYQCHLVFGDFVISTLVVVVIIIVIVGRQEEEDLGAWGLNGPAVPRGSLYWHAAGGCCPPPAPRYLCRNSIWHQSILSFTKRYRQVCAGVLRCVASSAMESNVASGMRSTMLHRHHHQYHFTHPHANYYRRKTHARTGSRRHPRNLRLLCF